MSCSISSASRENNARHDITGLLLYREGNFIQALEGPEAAVDRLHRTIEVDPRHHQMMTLLRGPLDARNFDGWVMGFRDVGEMDDEHRRSFSEFLTDASDEPRGEGRPHRVHRLLMSFKRATR